MMTEGLRSIRLLANIVLLLLLFHGYNAVVSQSGISRRGLQEASYYNIRANFSNVVFVSQTITTLQVVSNPLLERTFTTPNGSTIINPIHDAAFSSLAALETDLVRYVPWYPYPRTAVAELDAPVKNKTTSWDFTSILPMLMDFMDATYARNHSTVINFSTQPCWLFGDKEGKPQDCSYPDNADESFFGYVRGDRSNLMDPSSTEMANYYARLVSYLIKGEFVDEANVKRSGGPKYNLSRTNGHVWELFNEGEHKYNVDQYIHDYDVVVPKMMSAVGDQAPAFMGIGGSSSAWVAPFLNASKHDQHCNWAVPPIDYISQHFYGGCTNRTDPTTYSSGFFGGAKAYVEKVKTILLQRDASDFPQAKLALNELGVIMPNDNDPSIGIDGNLPDIYWNAAGAMYAYLFTQLVPLGVDVLGQSQLAGSPKIVEWGIPLPQFPSVSLLDWRTGLGNARYWVLKLLLEEFQPRDLIVQCNIAVTASRIRSQWQRSTNEKLSSDSDGIAVLSAISHCNKQKKVLLVNKQLAEQSVCLDETFSSNYFSLRIVDSFSVSVGSANGIREESINSACFVAQPFAVIVAFSQDEAKTE